ncbi:MAG TPA: D-alanine--D-alanine ligase family protein [Bryobacteraceae bacterium]|nr:D-alanine--D-alanine ligase family protein [Bryobacteraceae bacterium]
MSNNSKIRVAVLYGGRSGEHEVSVRSAESVIAALDPSKYEVSRIFITKEGRWQPCPISPEPGANPGIDVVFPVLHGTFGEDGTVQGLLELAGLPYVGAGVLASSVAMDKDAFKRLCRDRGLPIVEYVIAWRGALDAVEIPFSYPVFVKPANLGSSVGISKVNRPEDLANALRFAAEFDRKLVIERGIVGRELECSVLGNDTPEASLPCEILPSRDFYDYEDKYLLDKARTQVPADLSPAATAEIRRLAVACYQAVECEGMARCDFLLESATGKIYVNEINTIPGFTSISMYPKMWEATGLPYSELIDRLISLALERHRACAATRYER